MNFGYVTVNGVNSNNKYISKLSGKLKFLTVQRSLYKINLFTDGISIFQ